MFQEQFKHQNIEFHGKWEVKCCNWHQNVANSIENGRFELKMLQIPLKWHLSAPKCCKIPRKMDRTGNPKKKQNGKKQIPKQFRTHIFHSFFLFPPGVNQWKTLNPLHFFKSGFKNAESPKDLSNKNGLQWANEGIWRTWKRQFYTNQFIRRWLNSWSFKDFMW